MASHIPVQITSATVQDAKALTPLARKTFVESHGHSASEVEIRYYLDHHLTEDIMRDQLADAGNIFLLAFADHAPVGYAKLRMNSPVPGTGEMPMAKLERIYTLQSAHGTGIGQALWMHCRNLAREAGQLGIWLYTWTENHRAIQFYIRRGFQVEGHYDFPISPIHSNPNHLMVLRFDRDTDEV